MRAYHEEVLELGKEAMFKTEAESGDREADDLVVAIARDRDPGSVRAQKHQQVFTQLPNRSSESVFDVKCRCQIQYGR
jgi:hypothetical protein